jgi:hypothetical protein
MRNRNIGMRSDFSDREPKGGETLMNFLKWVRLCLKLRIKLEASLNIDIE